MYITENIILSFFNLTINKQFRETKYDETIYDYKINTEDFSKHLQTDMNTILVPGVIDPKKLCLPTSFKIESDSPELMEAAIEKTNIIFDELIEYIIEINKILSYTLNILFIIEIVKVYINYMYRYIDLNDTNTVIMIDVIKGNYIGYYIHAYISMCGTQSPPVNGVYSPIMPKPGNNKMDINYNIKNIYNKVNEIMNDGRILPISSDMHPRALKNIEESMLEKIHDNSLNTIVKLNLIIVGEYIDIYGFEKTVDFEGNDEDMIQLLEITDEYKELIKGIEQGLS